MSIKSILFGILASTLFFFSCEKKPQKPAPEKEQLSDLQTTDDAIGPHIDSLNEIRNNLFDKFDRYRGDTAFHWYSMFLDKEGGIFQGSIHIGYLFYPSQKSAVLGWSVSDSTMNLEVFNWSDSVWTAVFSAQNLPSEKFGVALRGPFLFFKDFNHDGWVDMEVVIKAWDGIGVGNNSKLWLVKKDKFTPVNGFENIDSPEPDEKKNLVYSYLSGGCADMAMHFSVWKLQSDSIRCIKNISVDCCVGEGPNCLVSVDHGASKPVPPHQVYLHVPKFYQKWIKEKMLSNE